MIQTKLFLDLHLAKLLDFSEVVLSVFYIFKNLLRFFTCS